MMRTRKYEIEEIISILQGQFARASYHSTSMVDLASALSLDKASLYHYFSSKEQIAVSIVEMLTRKCERIFSKALNNIRINKPNKLLVIKKAAETFFEQEKNAIIVAIFALECRDGTTRVLQRSLKYFFEFWYKSIQACFLPDYSLQEAAILAGEEFVSYFGIFIFEHFFAKNCANDIN